MNKNERARVIATRSFTAALSLILGVLITAQWRSTPSRIANPVAPYASLKETKETLYEDQKQLKKEIGSLQQSIEDVQKEIEEKTLGKNEVFELNNKKAQAGLTKLNGPGVVVIYDDSRSNDLNEDSIVHAADLRDTVNLLWAAGAEAISINGQRVIVNTAIDCIVNTVLVNNTRISNPFQIEAIGSREKMAGQLADPNLLSDIHKRKNDQGLVFNFKESNDLTLPAYDGSFEVKTGGGL